MTISANPLGGSETLDATSLDNPGNWDFYDPALDGEIEEDQQEGTESDAKAEALADDETEAVDEVDAQPDQDDDETELDEDPEGQPDASDDKLKTETFALPSGEKVSRDELIAGYMKGADYSRKTSQVAESRKAVEQQAQRMQRQIEVLTDYLVNALPEEPNASLAYTDPQTYTARKAVYDQQLANLQKLIAMADEPKKVAGEISGQVTREQLEAENAKLIAAFPQTADQKGRQEFFKAAFDAAGELGFSEAELQNVSDSRLFGLAYWAKKGMQAEQARVKAKQKVVNAPKAAPQKQRKVTQSNQAMKRLQRSGSIHDAVHIDFE